MTKRNVEVTAEFTVRANGPIVPGQKQGITVERVRLTDLPQSTAEERSRRAVTLWFADQDLQPLIDVLAVGDASTAAQELASELLVKAMKRKLPATRRHKHRELQMISTYLMAERTGHKPMEAMEIIEQAFGVSRKAVEKLIYGKRNLVDWLR